MIWATPTVLVLAFFLNLISVLAETSYGVQHQHGSCKRLSKRKEWRALSDKEKICYIDAVKCLQSRPAHNTSRPASWTRFDEFQVAHIDLAPFVHGFGKLLPWHRLFMKSYETALRDECGYKGAQPYWNWSIDADPPNLISKSPIWDPDIGFGGDGVPGTYVLPPDPTNTSFILNFSKNYRGCVKNGPFANYTLKLGPGHLSTKHCLTRGVNDTDGVHLTSKAIAETLTSSTYEKFAVALGGNLVPFFGPHVVGHFAVGGEMTNIYSSPGDPLFYLHHTNLDRIWWLWQKADPKRLYEVTGPAEIAPPFNNVTLSSPLQMGNIGTTLPIRDIMDIQKQPSCYIYI